MTKPWIIYLLPALFFLQGTFSFAADKNESSFFHGTRKTQIQKKAVEVIATVEVTAEEPVTTEKPELMVPPTPPGNPNRGYLVRNAPLSPRVPRDIPSPPPAIPGAPKAPPKAPSLPKTK